MRCAYDIQNQKSESTLPCPGLPRVRLYFHAIRANHVPNPAPVTTIQYELQPTTPYTGSPDSLLEIIHDPCFPLPLTLLAPAAPKPSLLRTPKVIASRPTHLPTAPFIPHRPVMGVCMTSIEPSFAQEL